MYQRQIKANREKKNLNKAVKILIKQGYKIKKTRDNQKPDTQISVDIQKPDTQISDDIQTPYLQITEFLEEKVKAARKLEIPNKKVKLTEFNDDVRNKAKVNFGDQGLQIIKDKSYYIYNYIKNIYYIYT